MTFRTLLLASVVEPMVAGVRGEHGPIRGLRGEVWIGTEDLDHARSTRWVARIQQRLGWAENDNQLAWAAISTPRETFEYAIGTAELSVEELNGQIDDLADQLEDWLSESDLAWGQQCSVPRPFLPASAAWD